MYKLNQIMPFSERREAERRMLESLLYTPAKDIALEDGRASREAALSLARKRRYTEARSRLEDARRCFEWSSGAGKDMKELQLVREELKVLHTRSLNARFALPCPTQTTNEMKTRTEK